VISAVLANFPRRYPFLFSLRNERFIHPQPPLLLLHRPTAITFIKLGPGNVGPSAPPSRDHTRFAPGVGERTFSHRVRTLLSLFPSLRPSSPSRSLSLSRSRSFSLSLSLVRSLAHATHLSKSEEVFLQLLPFSRGLLALPPDELEHLDSRR